jgi:hypothetical protein
MVTTVGKATKKEKKEKTKKTAMNVDKKLAVAPSGYDFTKYKPLKKGAFETEAAYLFHQADALEFKASAIRAKAELAKTLGSKKDIAMARRLVKMRDRFAAFRKELEDQGINVDAAIKAADAAKK